MKNKLMITLMLLVALPLYAQLDRSKIPGPGPAPEIKLGTYDTFQLQNGLKVFVVENHKIPRVAFNLVLDVDPILEGDSAGYVSAAGDLLRTGTKTRTKDQLDEDVDFIGGTLSTSSSGAYAVSLKKHTPKMLELMSDVVLNSVFKQEELDKIKKQDLSGLAAQKDDPDAIFGVVKNALYYGKDHPYGEPMTEKTVDNITLEMCKNYYNTYFKPNIAYLAVVGDINKDEAQKLVEKYFGSWKKGEVPEHKYNKPTAPLITKVALVDRPNSVQSVIGVGYPVDLKIGSEDVIKASVMNTILGGSFSSRLNHNLREEHGYTYGAGSGLHSDKVIGSFTASCTARNSVTDSAITQIFSEMKKMRTDTVSAEDLQSTKNYMTGGFARSLESPQTIASFAINIAKYNLPLDYYKNYLKRLSAVTVSDVHEIAKKYIKPNNAYVLVVGNGDEVADKLKKFSLSGKIDYYDVYGDKYDPSAKMLPEGLTVDSVLNKYVNAIGGKENILKVQDKTTQLSGTVQGMNLTLTISQKAPNKLYQVFDAGVFKVSTIFNGEKGVMDQMGKTQELTGDALEALKLQATMHAYLDYAKYNVKPELSGMEKVDGKDTYRVKVNLPDGKVWTQYYDVDSGYLVKQITEVSTQQGSFNQTIDFSDYKEVDGVKYPFKIVQSMGPQTIELNVDSIKVNTGLDDSLFEIK